MRLIHNFKPALLYCITVSLLFIRSQRNWSKGNKILHEQKKKDNKVQDFEYLKIFENILTNIIHT